MKECIFVLKKCVPKFIQYNNNKKRITYKNPLKKLDFV